MTQKDINRAAERIAKAALAETLAEVLREPARPDYSLAALMTLKGNSGRSTP